MVKKVILLTGASSGIGYHSAELLAKQGYIVYAGARRVEKIEPLLSYGVRPIKLDLTQESSIISCVNMVLEKEGHIDVLVNNAGYGSYGAIEDVDLAEARAQFEVNLFGLASLTKQVIPIMRKQKSGRIINISSVGGRCTTYFGGWYHATKYALEAFSDALRMELRGFGIEVVIIEPGGIRTPWGLIAADKLTDSAKDGAYENDANLVAKKIRKLYSSRMLSSPNLIAKKILTAIGQKKPKARYLVGFGAKPLAFLHAVLPTRAFDYLMKTL